MPQTSGCRRLTPYAVLLFLMAMAACARTPFEQQHAQAERKNPRWLTIEIDTGDGRHELKESQYIGIVTRYSSAMPSQYKAEVSEHMSHGAASDTLHLSDGTVIGNWAFECCDSRLIGLDDNAHKVPPRFSFRLQPGTHQMYLTTERVFRWDAGPKEYRRSSFTTASNLLTLKVIPDPGWQDRKLAELRAISISSRESCLELATLDVPAATAEKLKRIQECRQWVPYWFRPSEAPIALPALKSLIADPNHAVDSGDVSMAVTLEIWSLNPSLASRFASPERERSQQKMRSVLAAQYTDALAREICAELPQKSPEARKDTLRTLEYLVNFQNANVTCAKAATADRSRARHP